MSSIDPPDAATKKWRQYQVDDFWRPSTIVRPLTYSTGFSSAHFERAGPMSWRDRELGSGVPCVLLDIHGTSKELIKVLTPVGSIEHYFVSDFAANDDII